MASRDTYSQPEALDPILDVDQVVGLVRRHASIASTQFAIDETGGEARAYVLAEVVLKTQRPPRLRPRTSLAKEAFLLEQLARDATLKVPRLLGYGREGAVEYEVLSRIPGLTLRDAELSASRRATVWREVGATLRAIHGADQGPLRASGLVPGDATVSDVARRLRSDFEDTVAVLARRGVVVDSEDLRAEFLDGLSFAQELVVLHSNPGPEHCFVDPDSGLFTGLIDFGDAYRSHPALDVRSWRSPGDSRQMLEGYALGGQLDADFLRVWRAGVLVAQLRAATHSPVAARTLGSFAENLRHERGDGSGAPLTPPR